ncbi:hypothetical protein [Streptomyces sp. NPDC059850]
MTAPLDDGDEVFDLIGAITTSTSTSAREEPTDSQRVRAPNEMRDR